MSHTESCTAGVASFLRSVSPGSFWCQDGIMLTWVPASLCDLEAGTSPSSHRGNT